MDTRDLYKLVRSLEGEEHDTVQLHDSFDLELNEEFIIETGVVGFTKEGNVILHLDEDAMEYLDFNGILLEDTAQEAVKNAVMNRIFNSHIEILTMFGPDEVEDAVDDVAFNVGDIEEIGTSDVSIWTKQVIDYLKSKKERNQLDEGDEELEEVRKLLPTVNEAEYQGREVTLNKPFLTPDGPKKRSVYVRKPNDKIVKVNFGDKNMRIKKSDPDRRKSFRARHRCENPGPRWKARYWSCKFW